MVDEGGIFLLRHTIIPVYTWDIRICREIDLTVVKALYSCFIVVKATHILEVQCYIATHHIILTQRFFYTKFNKITEQHLEFGMLSLLSPQPMLA
jgi:hypothetical protein